jgi:hypothetical protein
MDTPGLVKYASAVVALAICSACSGGSAVAPSSAALNGTNTLHGTYVGRTLYINGRPVTAARLARGVVPRFAMIAPDFVPGRKREYVISSYGSYASIFNYPKSDAQVGTINNVGGQGCTNVLYGYGKGIIWIIAGQDQVTEYEVRKSTPIKTLPTSFSFPTSCAMDTNGDFALGNYDGGQVAVYKHASGTPTVYSTPLDEEFFTGYDNQGNLFADGFTGDRSGFELVELPKGSSTFKAITTSNAVDFPGSVQWDGTYLTVFDQVANELYQYTVSGTTATLKGTVSLAGSSDCAQTWIVKGLIYCGDAGNNDGEVFNYPAGGSATAVFTGDFVEPLGVTVAEKTRKIR